MNIGPMHIFIDTYTHMHVYTKVMWSPVAHFIRSTRIACANVVDLLGLIHYYINICSSNSP